MDISDELALQDIPEELPQSDTADSGEDISEKSPRIRNGLQSHHLAETYPPLTQKFRFTDDALDLLYKEFGVDSFEEVARKWSEDDYYTQSQKRWTS